MELSRETRTKYTFSGHESFQCRQFWLKKGYDFIKAGKSFSDEDAVVYLGVGKNMVTAIRFWLRAFNILNVDGQITDWSEMLLADDGWDPFLEDEASIWLLHYYLINTGYASTYSLIFNEFRKEKIEFNKENYSAYIKRKAEEDNNITYNENTIKSDFDVFVKLYTKIEDDNIEDSLSGILNDLNMLNYSGKGDNKFYYIENNERSSLPTSVFLYCILKKPEYSNTINLSSLEQDDNAPCSVFAINRAGIISKINDLTERHKDITYTDNAGVKEIQFKKKPKAIQILKNYYES